MRPAYLRPLLKIHLVHEVHTQNTVTQVWNVSKAHIRATFCKRMYDMKKYLKNIPVSPYH